MKHFQYFDGNNNRFVVSETDLVYEPIKPIFSSSGMYSGGEAKRVVLNAAEYQEIERIITKAINNVAEHIPQRLMGAALLKMQEDNKLVSCMLDMHSELKAEIEKVLHRLLSQP